MLIPYEIDLLYERRPWANYFVICLSVIVFIIQAATGHYDPDTSPNIEWGQVLHQASVDDLFGHMWMHGGFAQLLINLFFLWLFGSAVCAKIGNWYYIWIYVLIGVLSGLGHLLFNSSAFMGADGAIFGIIGMYIVFYPSNSFNWWFSILVRTFNFSSSVFWVVLYWLFLNSAATAISMRYVPWANHLIGFLSGLTLAIVMLSTRWITMDVDECSLLQVLGIHKRNERAFDRLGRKIGDSGNTQAAAEQESQVRHFRSKQNDETEIKLAMDIEKNIQPVQGQIRTHESSHPRLEPQLSESEIELQQIRRVSSKALETTSIGNQVHLICKCGRKFDSPGNDKTRQFRCPQCGSILQVHEPELNLRLEDSGNNAKL
jgi:membrane associated rhomboid family serine protease